MTVTHLPNQTDDVVHALELAQTAARSSKAVGAIIVLIDSDEDVEALYSHAFPLASVFGYLELAKERARDE